MMYIISGTDIEKVEATSFSELEMTENHIEELMLDPYANYMFQTLAQSCSSGQRYHLLEKVRFLFVCGVNVLVEFG